MSNLWIYWRRPSSVIRYRHGGESAIYPLLELVCRLFKSASFFYYYPKARGAGLVIEPLRYLSLPGGKRRKHQVRIGE